MAGGGSGRARGRRRRRREGRRCPAQAPEAGAGVSSRLLDAEERRGRSGGSEPGVSDSARSRGLATELRCGRAALPPRLEPELSPRPCRRSLAETHSGKGRGKPTRSSPHRGSHPRGRRRRQSRPPLTAPERVRGGDRLTGERRRSGCEVAAVTSSAPPRCARFADPVETEIQTAEPAAAAPSPPPRWG